MKTAPAIRKIPLNQLVLSSLNVRKTPPSAAADAELKASLLAHGLKQNLIVHDLPKDRFAVVAGGRRLKGLQALAEEGLIAKDYKVPCVVEETDAALESSLVENTIRAAMHPADEFAAMADLIDKGEPISAVALRFGVSERVVNQRLRLGKAAPKLLDAFRADEMSLDMVMAFTLAPDHKTQLAVWRQVKNQPYPSPHAVRRLLTEGAVPVNSSLGIFVGSKAYDEAGGKITTDLFSEKNDGFMDDGPLVRRLAIEKLETKAAEIKSAWSWTKALLDPDYGFTAEYDQIKGRPVNLTPKLAKELEHIEQRLMELEDIAADDWTDTLAEEADRLSDRQAEITELAGDEMIYPAEDRARAGCIVTIGDDGEFELHEGLVERDASADADADNSASDGDDGTAANGKSGAAPSLEKTIRKECGFSQALLDDLKAHRLQITKAHLAGDFALSFDLALYSLCLELIKFDHRSRPLSLSAVETRPRSSLNDLAGTPADQMLEARKSALDTDWLALPPAEAFDTLSKLPIAAKQELFAWCIASCLNGQLAIEDKANLVLERAGQRLAISLSDSWRPTAANYWGRTKKAHGLAVAEAVLDARWARDHADDKKTTLAAALENAFDPAGHGPCIGLDQAARERAHAWLPPGMAYHVTATDDGHMPDHEHASAHLSVCGDPARMSDANGTVATDLPAFLIEDEAPSFKPNGAGLGP